MVTVAIADLRAHCFQQVKDVQRGRISHIINVRFISSAQNVNAAPRKGTLRSLNASGSFVFRSGVDNADVGSIKFSKKGEILCCGQALFRH